MDLLAAPVAEQADEPEAGESVPHPEEIRRRCLEIQKEWSPRERAKRAGVFGRPDPWEPPVVTVAVMD